MPDRAQKVTMTAFAVRVVVVVALVGLPATPQAGTCGASAMVDGPSELTTTIAQRLMAHRVSVGATTSCSERVVRARVARGLGGTFHLHIEDGSGRTSDRVITDLGTAVSLIESWTLDEDADLLDAPAAPTSKVAVAAVEATAAAPAEGAALRAYAGLGSSLGSDHSLSGGGFAGACASVGRACLGAEVSGALDLGLLGDTADAGTTRLGVDLMLMTALPLARGRWLAMPRVGAGIGWTRTHVVPEDPDATAQTRNTLGFRGVVGVLGGVSLSRGIALALDLDAVIAPWAAVAPPDQTVLSPFPGEPRVSGRAAIACVVTP